jgi:hypothetical protein
MKNDTIDHAYAAIDLSDFSRDEISTLSGSELPTITLDSIDTFDFTSFGNVAPSSYSSDSYVYPNGVTSVNIGGYTNTSASTSIYTSHSPTITLSPNTFTNTSWAPLTVNGGNQSGITVKGDADIEGSLKVKGVDLGEMLSKMQDQLAIYQPAPELEEKWEELRELARKYKELVADIKEKQQIWDILKK